MASRRWGLACAIAGAVGFSVKSILVKGVYRYGVDSATCLALRMAWSLPLFVAMGLNAERRATVSLKRLDYHAFVVLGFLGYYLSSTLDFLGLQLISASLERAVLYLSPTFVVLLVARRERRWPSPRTWRSLALCYGGLVLAMVHDLTSRAGAVWLGVVLVLGSAISYALYMERAGTVVARIGSQRLAAWATTAACLMALAQFALLRPAGLLVHQPWQVQALSASMALFSTALPVWLVAEGMRVLGSGTTAIIGTLGPVITTLLAWLVLGEPLGAWQLAGLALVILGVQQVARRA